MGEKVESEEMMNKRFERKMVITVTWALLIVMIIMMIVTCCTVSKLTKQTGYRDASGVVIYDQTTEGSVTMQCQRYRYITDTKVEIITIDGTIYTADARYCIFID